MLRSVFVGMLIGAAAFGSSQVAAQDFPNRPITIYTGDPGGPNDFVSRLIAEGMSANLGVAVTVQNLKGGRGAAEFVMKAEPDGYSVLTIGSTLWLSPFFRENVAWDPVKDFQPVTLTSMAPNVLVVHPSVPVNSVQELLALAKTRPGELMSATGPIGSATFLGIELLKSMTGLDIVSKVHKGNAPAIKAVVAGETQMMFATSGSAAPHIQSGALKALAVTSERQSELLPDLPTVAATVLGYDSTQITTMHVPANTPPEVVRRLNEEISRVLNSADAKKKLLEFGVEVVASTPEYLAAKINSEMDRLGKVLQEAAAK